MVVEGYKDNPLAGRQTILHFINFTNQQPAAYQALNHIAVYHFQQCHTAFDLAQLEQQLEWMPQPFSAPLGSWVTQGLELAHNTKAALEASTPYRQRQFLGQVGKQLTQLQNRLAAGSAFEATTFGPLFQQWEKAITHTQEVFGRHPHAAGEIPNAYIYGDPLNPALAQEVFKGRVDLFRQIENLLLGRQKFTLLLYGGRRAGKTSTLNYLPSYLPMHQVPLLVDVQQVASFAQLENVVQGMADSMARSAKLGRQVELPPFLSTPADPLHGFQTWLNQIEKKHPDKQFLLCLDEYERLENVAPVQESYPLLHFLRHLMQHNPNWTVLLAGSHLLNELKPFWSDYLINAYTVRVSFLGRADTESLIRHPIEQFPAVYADEVVEEIWQLTQGQPYFVQLLCHQLVELLNQEKRHWATLPDVQAVLPKVFEGGHMVFHEFWQTSNTAETRPVLRSILQGDWAAVQEQKAAVDLLLRKEFIVPEGSGYRLTVPLIGRWLLAQGLV
jgi:hypothetical protein